MRISDWSSDVCSSYLSDVAVRHQEPLKRPAGHKRQRRLTAEDGRVVRLAQPGDRLGRAEENGKRLVKGEHRRDAQEHRCRQGEVVLGAGSRAPAVICGARGGPENAAAFGGAETPARSEEHTSELQSLMRTSYAVFCLKKK